MRDASPPTTQADCALQAGSIKRSEEDGLVTRAGVLNTGTLVVESLLRIGLVTLVSMWIARELGPEQFGIINLASAVVAVCYAVSTLGLDTPVLLRLSRGHDPQRVLGAAIAMRLIASIACIALACAVAASIRPGDGVLIQIVFIVSLTIPVYAFAILDSWFKVAQKAVAPAASRMVATVFSSGSKVACLLMGFGVLGLAWTVLFESVVASVGLLLAYVCAKRYTGGRHLIFAGEEMRSLLRGLAPYALGVVALVAYMKVDVVMLGALSSHEQTGLYSLSQKICEVLYVVPVVLADVIYPRLGRASNPGSFPTESESQTFFDLAVGASILVAFAAVVLSRPLISGLFGEAYGPAVDIFQVHAFSCIGVAVAHVRFKLLAAAGMQKQALMVALCGLALAVVLNASLIPIAGAMGAAIATVISHFLAGYAAAVLWPELRHVTVLQTRSLWPWVRLMRMSKGVGSKGAVA